MITNKKIAIITGASRGIGYSLALSLAKENIFVIAIARTRENLEELKSQFTNFIHIIPCDIGTEEGKKTILSFVTTQQLKIDYIIHNAAIINPIGQLQNRKENELRSQFEINFFAPLFLTQQLLPHMREESRILVLSSVAGQQVVSGLGGYCMSKAALNMWTEILKDELKFTKIGISIVIPGEVKTKMQQELREAPLQDFPLAKEFQDAHSTLIDPELCASFLFYVLTKTSLYEFRQTKWNIYDIAHHKNWLNGKLLPMPLNKEKLAKDNNNLAMYSMENQLRYEKEADIHDRIQLDSTLYLAYRDLPKLLINNFKPETKNIRLLDFGCGTGTSTQIVSDMLINLGYQVEIIGLDISEQNMKIAEKKLPHGKFYSLKSSQSMPEIQNVDIALLFFVSVENKSTNVCGIFKYLHQQLKSTGILLHINPSARSYDRVHKWYTVNSNFDTNIRTQELVKSKFQEDQILTLSQSDKKNNAAFQFTDFFHSGKFYLNLYKDLGFKVKAIHKPLGEMQDKMPWQDEKTISPYKIHIIEKQVSITSELENELKYKC